MNITKADLLEILKLHNDWLNGVEGGRRANLICANLSGADLGDSDLRDANLSDSDLSGANLSDSDLRHANLSGANLICANLSGADLGGANLGGADLSDSDLSGAVGGNARVECLQIQPYRIVIVDKHIVWGGCTKKTAQEWLDYDGADIDDDKKKYLETITKPFIRMVLGK